MLLIMISIRVTVPITHRDDEVGAFEASLDAWTSCPGVAVKSASGMLCAQDRFSRALYVSRWLSSQIAIRHRSIHSDGGEICVCGFGSQCSADDSGFAMNRISCVRTPRNVK
jgi:hypothetical protein